MIFKITVCTCVFLSTKSNVFQTHWRPQAFLVQRGDPSLARTVLYKPFFLPLGSSGCPTPASAKGANLLEEGRGVAFGAKFSTITNLQN